MAKRLVRLTLSF